jgi:hypothetical protein
VARGGGHGHSTGRGMMESLKPVDGTGTSHGQEKQPQTDEYLFHGGLPIGCTVATGAMDDKPAVA